VLSRLAARIVTGPIGFLVAGTLDLASAWGRWAAGRVRARVGQRKRERERVTQR
jgi:hypothetical protein